MGGGGGEVLPVTSNSTLINLVTTQNIYPPKINPCYVPDGSCYFLTDFFVLNAPDTVVWLGYWPDLGPVRTWIPVPASTLSPGEPEYSFIDNWLIN